MWTGDAAAALEVPRGGFLTLFFSSLLTSSLFLGSPVLVWPRQNASLSASVRAQDCIVGIWERVIPHAVYVCM